MAVSVVAAWARHSAAFRRTAGRRNGQAAGGGRTRRAGGARRRAARVAAGGERRVGRKKRRPGRAHLRPELVEARRRVELGEVGDGDDGVRVAPLTAPAREVARVAEERAGPAASAARAATGGDALFFEVVLVVGVAVEAFAVAAIVVVVVGIDRRRAGRRRRAAPPERLQPGAMHGAEREQLDALVVARIGRVRRRPKLQHAVARVGRLVVVVLQPCAAAAAAARSMSVPCRHHGVRWW